MKLNTPLFNSHCLAATTSQLSKINLPTVMIPDIVSSTNEIQTLLNKQLLLLKFVPEK